MGTNHTFADNIRMVAETYDKMRPSVVSYVCKRLGGGLMAEAEDMCQDIFLQILTYDKELTAEMIPGLVYRMAHNRIVDYYRHHTRTIAAQEFFSRHSARSACTTEEIVVAEEIERIEQEAVGRMSGPLLICLDISLRPPEVDEKLRFGDFEIDTIIGKKRKGAVMTINDRCTKIVFIRRLTGKEADPLARMTIDTLQPYKDMIHTITADNGKEFARHKEIAKGLDVQFFFARPYHSWERGANE